MLAHVATMLLLAPAPEPDALDAMSRDRLVYRNTTVGRTNPAVAANDLVLGYRAQIVARDTPLFRDSFLLIGPRAILTPALVRLGPLLELWDPLESTCRHASLSIL